MSSNLKTKSTSSCKKFKNSYPNFTPVILDLSVHSSEAGAYTQVTIFGNNFSSGSAIGYSVVNFGDFTNLPTTFYGSTRISFTIPTIAKSGVYNIQVVNVLYPTSLYSNIVNYALM